MRTRPAARVTDLEEIAMSLPHVRTVPGFGGLPAFQVGKKLFAAFRSARPDAVDPDTGERLTDVIIIWTPDEQDKLALAQGPGPWFTTDHFNGYNAILIRQAHLGRISRAELAEVVTDAWCTRAPHSMVRKWQESQGDPDNRARSKQ
ncbi:MAG: MmcQ/YjbR family DNA-binding protein [Propionibacteriaceae bacterium]